MADLVSLVRSTIYKTQTPSLEDFKASLQTPSLLKSSQLSIESLSWDSIGGMESVKKILRQSVEWPLKHSEKFLQLGIQPPRGILLYGPPGCSKTSLAKVLASSTGLAFCQGNLASIYSANLGESESTIRGMFATARACQPCIIFFDEIDALVGKRGSGGGGSVQERILSTLLNEMDGIENSQGVLVIGATNRPDMIDSALMRPGRFDKVVYVPAPTAMEREEILGIYTKGMPLGKVDLKIIAEMTSRCTGADLKGICREAALVAVRLQLSKANSSDISDVKVLMDHFVMAIGERSPTLSDEMLQQYTEFGKQF